MVRRKAKKLPVFLGDAPSAGRDLSHIHPSLHPMVVRIADVVFLADNPLDHDDREIEDMRAILKARGQLVPLIVNRRQTPPVVLGGNKRLRAMLAESWEWVAVLYVDLAEDDAAALAIELNVSQGQLWNKDLLAKAMHQMDSLSLGEQRDAMMARLAEAEKLIPRLGGRRTSDPCDDDGDDDDEEFPIDEPPQEEKSVANSSGPACVVTCVIDRQTFNAWAKWKESCGLVKDGPAFAKLLAKVAADADAI